MTTTILACAVVVAVVAVVLACVEFRDKQEGGEMLTVNVHGFNPQDGRDQYDVDEIVSPGFHLETLGDDVWLSLHDADGRRVTAIIAMDNGRLVVRVQDDDRTADERAGDKNTPAGGQWGAWHPMFDGGK